MRLLYFVMCNNPRNNCSCQRLVNQWWEPGMACVITELDGCSMLLYCFCNDWVVRLVICYSSCYNWSSNVSTWLCIPHVDCL